LFAGLGFLRWGDYFIEPNAQSHASSHIPHSLLPLIAVFWPRKVIQIFLKYIWRQKIYHTPLPPLLIFWPRKVIQIFLKYIWRQKNTTLTHSPAPCDFFVKKSNSNNFEIYLATKKHHHTPLPAPPIAVFCHEK
jgi:hypothetical protein